MLFQEIYPEKDLKLAVPDRDSLEIPRSISYRPTGRDVKRGLLVSSDDDTLAMIGSQHLRSFQETILSKDI